MGEPTRRRVILGAVQLLLPSTARARSIAARAARSSAATSTVRGCGSSRSTKAPTPWRVSTRPSSSGGPPASPPERCHTGHQAAGVDTRVEGRGQPRQDRQVWTRACARTLRIPRGCTAAEDDRAGPPPDPGLLAGQRRSSDTHPGAERDTPSEWDSDHDPGQGRQAGRGSRKNSSRSSTPSCGTPPHHTTTIGIAPPATS